MAKFRQKGFQHHWGISPKWKISTFGRVFIPKWQHSALGKSEKRRKIPPFLLCQTEIKSVLEKSPIKDPSALSSDAKFHQNGVTHGSDCQNRSECPNFRRLDHHAQNGISAIGQIPSPHEGQGGSHSLHKKNGTSPKRRQGESIPTGSKIKPSTPQIVRITKPQGGKGDSIHH